MEYRRLGTGPLNVSAIFPGTMTFGQQNSEAGAMRLASAKDEPFFTCW